MNWLQRLRSPLYIGGTHFLWREAVTRSGYTSVKALPAAVKKRVRVHATNLEKLRKEINKTRKSHHLAETGINILSWVRSPEHNREVGGAGNSRHMYGDATDITLQEIDRLCPWPGGRTFFENVANKTFSDGGFGQYPGGNRHVDSRGYRARWTTWTPGR